MNFARISKAIGGLLGAAAPVIAALVAYQLISGDTATRVAGIIAALTPIVAAFGVYFAPPNQ